MRCIKVFFAAQYLQLPFMKSSTCILILFSVIHFKSVCAQKEKKRIFEISAGAIAANCLSKSGVFSSLPFSGTGWGDILTATCRKDRTVNEFSAHYATGQLRHSSADIKIRKHYSAFDYAYLYNLNSSANTGWHVEAGGSINIIYSENVYPAIVNNKPTIDCAGSVAGAVAVRYSWNRFLRGLSVSNVICVPVISAIQQPSYSAEASSKTKFTSACFGSFVRIVNTVKASAPTDQRGRLFIAYRFDYYNYHNKTVSRQAFHGLEAGYTIIL
ncbi:MAG: hypothetical protein H0X41_04305 [Chitinophagaceae bacterium]|nr:hypothetical protein [Chitinophagaceae bacterium]